MKLRAWVSGGLSWILFAQSIVAVMPRSPVIAHASAPRSVERVPADQDPYFLGTQTWDSRAAYGALSVEIPGAGLVLNVRQPLVALGQAGDWAFFAPQSGSTLDEVGSQGLYFVRVRELYQSAQARVTVPFFYLPLPAQASEYTASSTHQPDVLALVEQESILITDNQGVAFAVPAADIQGYEKNATLVMELAGLATQEAQLQWLESSSGQAALAPVRERMWNAMLAQQSSSAGSFEQGIQSVMQEILALVPAHLRGQTLPAGSTQLHGLLPVLPLKGLKGTTQDSRSWGARVWEFALPSAWAADSQALELAARTALVVANCSLFFTAGVLLKHSLLKERVVHVQYFVLKTAITNANLILDELTHGLSTYGLGASELRKAFRLLRQIEEDLPALRVKRDAQLQIIAKRVQGKVASERKVDPEKARLRAEHDEVVRSHILEEWRLLEQKLSAAQSALTSGQVAQSGSNASAKPSEDVAHSRKQLMNNLGSLKDNLNKASGSALEFKTNVGVFGHVLTLIAQIPAVWGTHTLRYVMDRLGIAEHRKIRQMFFEPTFGFAQRTSDKTPVNSTTVKLGTGVMNAIDTGNVGIQLYGFNPWFSRVAGSLSPSQWLKDKITEAFGSENADTANYNMITLVGNLVAYIAVGAYTVAHDQQEILTQLYDREVKRELKDRGMDVESAEARDVLRDEVRKRVRAGLLMRGFPTEEEFLFDANSTYAKLRASQGYEVPAGTKSPDHAQQRPGRVREVLEQAIKRAGWQKDFVVQNGLQGIQGDLDLIRALKNIAKATLKLATFTQKLDAAKAAYRQSRKELVALTIKESPEQDADVIVDVVLARFGGDREAALRAWDLMREEWERILDPARAKVEKEALLRDREDAKFLAKEKKEHEKEMNPELRLGAFGRWQISRALEKADLAAVAANGDPQVWEKTFRDALVAESGLTIEQTPATANLLGLVERQVKESWTERLGHKDFAAYYHGLGAMEQRKLRVIYQAEFFASAYSDLTINKKTVPALSSAQPGLLQALRQRAWVSNSKVLTYAARFVEGGFSNGRYQLGFWPKVYRSVPLFEDALVLGATRSMRRFPVAMTFGLAWGYTIWATAYSPSMFVLNFVVSALTVAGPWSMVTRMMDNIGVKQGSTVSGMALFSSIGSWATMWGMLLTPIIAPVVQPVLKPVDELFSRTGFIIKKVNPETQEERFVVAPHPSLTLCKDLLRPIIDGPAKPASQQTVDGSATPTK